MDSRLRGNDDVMDSCLRGNDDVMDSCLRGNDDGGLSRSRPLVGQRSPLYDTGAAYPLTYV